jgi:hypothetical protein
VGRIDLHDVPQDRLPIDPNHGLGAQHGFFGQLCPQATRKNYGIRKNSFSSARQTSRNLPLVIE